MLSRDGFSSKLGSSQGGASWRMPIDERARWNQTDRDARDDVLCRSLCIELTKQNKYIDSTRIGHVCPQST
jgi:hypothetical protein